jgi:hypothetical protein
MEDNRNPRREICLNLKKSPIYRRRNIWQDEVRGFGRVVVGVGWQ